MIAQCKSKIPISAPLHSCETLPGLNLSSLELLNIISAFVNTALPPSSTTCSLPEGRMTRETQQCSEGPALARLGTHLLLEGGGHQAPQLRQAAVDAVAAPLLDDLREISEQGEETTVTQGTSHRSKRALGATAG